MNKYFLIGLFLIFILAPSSYGQKEMNTRPKIGLVLSGGGAKGLAHIGVLKVIDSLGIKIDHIGGTSMGAVVGAMYASGYSAKQIEAIATQLNFSEILQDKLDRKHYSFFDKQHQKYLINLPIDKGGIGIPRSIAVGQRAYNDLSSLLFHVNHIKDFSNLPIPFFCIAADIDNGNTVVFDKGHLPSVIRASSSLPTLIEPVLYDGTYLIDGGIADNFPVFEMQKKNVDFIIGVDVQEKLSSQDKIDTALDMLNQILNYQSHDIDTEKIKKLGIYIHPNVGKYAVTSFDKTQELIDLGVEASMPFVPKFLSLNKGRIEANVDLKSEKITCNSCNNYQSFYIDEIDIKVPQNYTSSYVKGKLKIDPSDEMSMERLNDRVLHLTSTKNFSLIQYKLKEKANNIYSLSLDIEENKWSKLLKFGLHYDPLYESSLLVNLTNKHIFRQNDVLSTDFVFGDQFRFYLNYFVDNGDLISYGLNSQWVRFHSDVKNENTFGTINSDVSFNDFSTKLFLQSNFNKKFAISSGLMYKIYKEKNTTIDNENSDNLINSHYLIPYSSITLDALDDPLFPRKGLYFNFGAKWYVYASNSNGSFNPFTQIDFKFRWAQKYFKKVVVELGVQSGLTIGENSDNIFMYGLGGYGFNFINNHIAFAGHDFNSLQDNFFLKTSLQFRYHFAKSHFLRFYSDFAQLSKSPIINKDFLLNLNYGYAVGYGFESFLGPLDITYQWSPQTDAKGFFVCLGYWF